MPSKKILRIRVDGDIKTQADEIVRIRRAWFETADVLVVDAKKIRQN